MYDVIVVGARCAGSPLAMLLARKGYRVVVLDRASFPRDTVSTHYVQPSGLARLRRWGLLDRLTATGCPPVTEALWWFGETSVRGFAPPHGDIAMALAPRRTVLDALLVDAAREAGAEVRESCTVRSLVRADDGRVTGVRCQEQGGAEHTLSAPIVIGADGRDSLVARETGAEKYNSRPPLTVVYYTYWRGLRPERRHRNEVFLEGDKQIGVIPTHDDAYLIQAARPHDFFGEYRSDIERHYLKAIEEAAPALASELADGAERVERFRGSASLENFYRKPYGPGWALVGDAGYHKDPLTGQGISDAWRDAELLAHAVHEVRSGHTDWDTAMAGYERLRNAASELIYEFTCEAASFEFDPMTRQLVRVLAENRDEADRFFGVIAGTVPAEEFFAPDNLLSMLARLPAEALAEITGTEGTR
ncbi:NAD(P)/FAD-dependent oxidoreductase [Streptomyces sp. NBC_00572]|uniref:NAD(P)/FAD-dependent oxidoreductase n=1 Tax=Streptomyces sp. NBC_00572 TaxID=2903664 RepID=UPI0022518898|nr:NAD(P)/FAD-dependent oxidoreductase [Streptomyces sp. NBC_00572]MCX4984962.1 NAD(P)/FAD-dependent oxidoreductase [Streptomyces sp. NBC_00572]